MPPTVLFASPCAEARAAVCAALESAGYLTLAAADGAEALELVRREGGRVDVALVELVMPRMGGLVVTGHLRDFASQVAVLLDCGNPAGGGGPALARRADGVLQRPFDRVELLRAVGQGLSRPQQRPKPVRAVRIFRTVAGRV